MKQFQEIFIISDIHGCYDEFEEMLNNWDRENQMLCINGDSLDRGPNSLKVIRKLIDLTEQYPNQVIVQLGNHEQMFKAFIDEPAMNGDMYFKVGGYETVESMYAPDTIHLCSFNELVELIEQHYANELEFIFNKMALYSVFGDVLIVHAGVDMTLAKDYKNSSEDDFLWNRDIFKEKNTTGKIIVFGHTPTQSIHSEKHNNSIWINEEKDLIGIDGACSFGGQLNGIVLNRNGEILNMYAVQSKIAKIKNR